VRRSPGAEDGADSRANAPDSMVGERLGAQPWMDRAQRLETRAGDCGQGSEWGAVGECVCPEREAVGSASKLKSEKGEKRAACAGKCGGGRQRGLTPPGIGAQRSECFDNRRTVQPRRSGRRPSAR